jgi:thiol-disulfide isomerase/thioredoxin
MAYDAAWAALILSATGCSGRPPSRPFEPASHETAVGHAVSDIEVAGLGGGSTIRLGQFRGKAMLLNIWASYCAPCKQELPMLDDAAERLRAKGVEIVAISVDESVESAKDFLQSRASWSIAFGHDPARKHLRRLEVQQVPSSYVVDRTGVIRAVYGELERFDFGTIENQLIELGAAP